MLHSHKFQPLKDNEHRLYCECGEKRCMHFWEKIRTERCTYVYLNGNVIIDTLQCQHCGYVKNVRSDEYE